MVPVVTIVLLYVVLGSVSLAAGVQAARESRPRLLGQLHTAEDTCQGEGARWMLVVMILGGIVAWGRRVAQVLELADEGD